MKSSCRRTMALVALAVGVLLSGGSVRADDSKLRARALIKSGDTYYRLARFKAALDNYSEALALRNHPAIVFNIAQCHRQLQDTKKAVFYYKLYLAEWERKKPGTNPPFEEEVKGHIKLMTALLEQQKATAAERQRKKEEAEHRQKEEERRRPATTRPDPMSPAPTSQPQKDEAPPPPGKSKLWLVAGITTAAAAAGMLGLGIAHDVKSSGFVHGSDEWAEAANVGLTGYILAGGFAVASGVCWFLHARSGRPAPAAAMVPLPGGAVVTGIIRF